MKKRVLFGLVAVTMAACMITGCGTSTDGNASESGSSKNSSGAKTVTVGVSQTLAPYIYLDDDGNLTGYDYDILQELDKRLDDYDFEYSPADFSTNLVSIESGAIDMMVNNLVQSEERKEKYLFPEHYSCLAPMCLAVKDDSNITSLEDMDGKKMNQNPASYEYSLVQDWMKDNSGTNIDIVAVSDLTTADNLKQVSNGTVDAALVYQSTFDSTMEKMPEIKNLKTTDVVLCEDVYYMFNNSDKDLCDAVDKALGDMYDDGFMSENSTKWFKEDIFEKYKDMISISFDK